MKNLPLYTEGALTASDRRTQNGLHGLICRLPWNLGRSFVKCDLLRKPDGSQGHLFNIGSTQDCAKPKRITSLSVVEMSQNEKVIAEKENKMQICNWNRNVIKWIWLKLCHYYIILRFYIYVLATFFKNANWNILCFLAWNLP